MKRILMLVSLLAFLGYLMATPGPDHKVFWCHYPPGQWTGQPATSKVLILSIDVAAEPGHIGHSPTLPGFAAGACSETNLAACAEGVTADGKADNCPGVSASTCPNPPLACAVQSATPGSCCTLLVSGGVFMGCSTPPPAGASFSLVPGPIPGITGSPSTCVCPPGTPRQGLAPITSTTTPSFAGATDSNGASITNGCGTFG
jgi:hypothetical protein